MGANFATLGDVEQLDNEIGFVGGAFLSIKFKTFDIQPELLYSQQGERFNLSEFNLDYINMPVVMKFYLVGGLNLQLGPQFGFLVYDNVPDSIIDGFKTNTFDVTGVGGLGIDLPLNLRADARYVFDIDDEFKSADFDNGFFTLSIGFTLF